MFQVGETVKWHDPDGETLTGYYKVTEVVTDEDTGEVVYYILGEGTEAFPHELEAAGENV